VDAEGIRMTMTGDASRQSFALATSLALHATLLFLLAGRAFLAGLGTGVWESTDDLKHTWALDRRFEPKLDRDAANAAHKRWRDAVERAKNWAS
jgi:glycerol kinase